MKPEAAVQRCLAAGKACLQRGDVAGAEAAFHEASDRSGGDPAVLKGAADAYRRPAWRLHDLPGCAEDAWRLFQNARALCERLGAGFEHNAAKICRGLSITSGKLGDLESALAYS